MHQSGALVHFLTPGSAAKPNAVVAAMNDALFQFSRDIAGKLKTALSN